MKRVRVGTLATGQLGNGSTTTHPAPVTGYVQIPGPSRSMGAG